MSKRITLNDLEIEVLYKMVAAQINDAPPLSTHQFHKIISLDIFRRLFDKLECVRFEGEK